MISWRWVMTFWPRDLHVAAAAGPAATDAPTTPSERTRTSASARMRRRGRAMRRPYVPHRDRRKGLGHGELVQVPVAQRVDDVPVHTRLDRLDRPALLARLRGGELHGLREHA